MKDFAKSIRTGNETAEERLGLNPIIEGVTKDIIEIYKKNGKNRELTKKELIERHHLTEKQAEEALRKIVGNTKSLNKAIVLKDGNVWVVLYANETKSQEFETEAEAREFAKKVGNRNVGNAYEWREKNGRKELYNPSVPFGGHTRGYVEKGKSGYVGAKTNGSIIISKKEFASEEEAKKYVENRKVGNGFLDSYEFLLQAGKSDYNYIKEAVKKSGGWTPEIKEKAKKSSDTLEKKAKELIQTAQKQASDLERLAGEIRSI